ncbi:polysaccharide deacetylase family protein [Microbacterium oleivorans]|uniref:polysaccharide deacetylase family protein n=1 Tax=Microbacterium oleivorans TaxID=273677 RepID=UPI0009F734D5|nr:polysaccharide deacetylase family protein [Microbacterium oleivorans]
MVMWDAADHRRVMILNFHGIGTPGRMLEPGEERFWVTADRFHEILDTAVRHHRRVQITFDDANASDHEVALPALRDRGIHARFFVITDRIGATGSLDAAQLVDLARHGMKFGTHGATHRPWPELAKAGTLHGELIGSAMRLGAIVGEPIAHAAFPQGLYDRRVLGELRRSGFPNVYSVDEGWNRGSAAMRTRYSVIHSDDAASIRALLDRPTRTTRRWPARALTRAVKRWR